MIRRQTDRSRGRAEPRHWASGAVGWRDDAGGTPGARVTRLRWASGAHPTSRMVVDADLECGHEGVEVVIRTRARAPSATSAASSGPPGPSGPPLARLGPVIVVTAAGDR